MLALNCILTFDFYMISCSRQIVYLNNCSVVRFSFDPCFSGLFKCELSTYQIYQYFRYVHKYQDFLIGQRDVLSTKLSNEDFYFTLSRLVRCTPCKEQCALQYLQLFKSWIFAAKICTLNVGCQRKRLSYVVLWYSERGKRSTIVNVRFVVSVFTFYLVYLQSTITQTKSDSYVRIVPSLLR